MHLVNKTPIDWYLKKQATIETATYGSEFVAVRTCIKQIIDLRTTLCNLGVPICEQSYMFGDNESVINSSTMVHAKLHKRHTALSFHRVHEAIASGMIKFNFIPGNINPADVLSKHWGYSQVWMQLKMLLFWQGNTIEINGFMSYVCLHVLQNSEYASLMARVILKKWCDSLDVYSLSDCTLIDKF